jgi:hypothetical protein
VVDAVTYAGSALTSIDLRFEQRCGFPVPVLHGQIHWAPGDTTSPSGPVNPPPAGLWTPAAFTPPAGNYVHLESDAGDYVGVGATFDYTQATAVFYVQVIDGFFRVDVNSDIYWTGYFMAMSTLMRLEPGYYGHLKSFLSRNRLRGGLDWFGAGRGCNTLTGWFAVDAVTYSGSTLTSIDLRFEQHCEGVGPALHGQIHWDTSDTTAPPGPVDPPPAGLWTPVGFTPPPGNYVHLESDAGDYVGGGITRDYSAANAAMGVGTVGWGGHLSVAVSSSGVIWDGDFVTMLTRPRFELGYYGGLMRYPFHNPIRGGLAWSGDGRACTIGTNDTVDWFVVDAVTYSGNTLTAIDLRFEQHCAGGVPALHGLVHWVAP